MAPQRKIVKKKKEIMLLPNTMLTKLSDGNFIDFDITQKRDITVDFANN